MDVFSLPSYPTLNAAGATRTMTDHPTTESSEERPAPTSGSEPVAYYQGANNARWVVIGFLALVAALVLYMALGMPGMNHGGGGGMDHENMDMGEMLP